MWKRQVVKVQEQERMLEQGLDARTKSTLGILSVPARKLLKCVCGELNLKQNAEGVSGEAWEAGLRHLHCQEATGSHKLVLCKVTREERRM